MASGSYSKQETIGVNTPGEFHLRVYRVRLLVAVLTVVSIILFLSIWLDNGIRLRTFASNNKSNEEWKEITDAYNSASGIVVALFSPILDWLIKVVSAVGLLICWPTFILQNDQGLKAMVVKILPAAVITFLISNAMDSINVQTMLGPLQLRIVNNDLMPARTVLDDGQGLDVIGTLATAWNKSFSESSPGNSILNTILRQQFVPYETYQTESIHLETEKTFSMWPSVEYGIQSQAWHLDVLQSAIVPTGTLAFPLNVEMVDAIEDSAIPMEKSTLATLLTYLILAAPSVLPWWNQSIAFNCQYMSDLAFDFAKSNDPTFSTGNSTDSVIRLSELLGFGTDVAPFATTASRIISEFFTGTNVLMDDERARVNISSTTLGGGIVFDAVTIDLPVITSLPRRKDNTDEGFQKTSTENVYDYLSSSCVYDGCTCHLNEVNMARNETKTTINPFVMALPLNTLKDGSEDILLSVSTDGSLQFLFELLGKINHPSNTSMLIVSLGKQIIGDDWNRDLLQSPAQSYETFTNPRVLYSLTIGRISWPIEDLAKIFDADCSADTCLGVRLQTSGDTPLTVLAGVKSLPTSSLELPPQHNTSYPLFKSWKYLVRVTTDDPPCDNCSITNFPPTEVILPRSFTTVSGDVDPKSYDLTNQMRYSSSKFIYHMVKNHIFIEHPLQVAYSAGLMYLFQDAVVHDILTSDNHTGLEMSVTGFKGNFQEVYVYLSIPRTNAILTFAGCGLFLLGLFGVFRWMQQSEGIIHDCASPASIATALLNTTLYPTELLKIEIKYSYDGSSVETQLQNFTIQRITLVNPDEHEVDVPFQILQTPFVNVSTTGSLQAVLDEPTHSRPSA